MIFSADLRDFLRRVRWKAIGANIRGLCIRRLSFTQLLNCGHEPKSSSWGTRSIAIEQPVHCLGGGFSALLDVSLVVEHQGLGRIDVDDGLPA